MKLKGDALTKSMLSIINFIDPEGKFKLSSEDMEKYGKMVDIIESKTFTDVPEGVYRTVVSNLLPEDQRIVESYQK